MMKALSLNEFVVRRLTNRFLAIGLLLYPLKTSVHQRFSGGIEINQWHKMG